MKDTAQGIVHKELEEKRTSQAEMALKELEQEQEQESAPSGADTTSEPALEAIKKTEPIELAPSALPTAETEEKPDIAVAKDEPMLEVPLHTDSSTKIVENEAAEKKPESTAKEDIQEEKKDTAVKTNTEDLSAPPKSAVEEKTKQIRAKQKDTDKKKQEEKSTRIEKKQSVASIEKTRASKPIKEKQEKKEPVVNPEVAKAADTYEAEGSPDRSELLATPPAQYEEPAPTPEAKEKPSRSVKITVGQKLAVVYPGEGWVYIGETTAQIGLRYQQRKIEDKNSLFTFIADKEGDYILNFSRYDVFSDEFIPDALSVRVDTAKEKNDRTVRAPDYKQPEKTSEVLAEKNIERPTQKESPAPLILDKSLGNNTKETEKPEGGSETTPLFKENTERKNSPAPVRENPLQKDSREYLDGVRQQIAEGNAAGALASLEQFFVFSENRIDEAWFLRGQAYELNGPNRNIRLALDAYQTVTKTFPQSQWWEKSNDRIRYIKNFYINIH
ncbi:hypothetical protein HPC63_12035 [Treponema phagedenis]|nr:hypothetical protein [Treponema phagedenis]